MDALNQKERTAGFWKFLATFLLLLVVVILATYLAVGTVPGQELGALKDENYVLKQQADEAGKLLTKLAVLQSEMDSYRSDTLSSNPVKAKQLYTNLTSDILKLQSNSSDSSDVSRIQSHLTYTYSSWLIDVDKIKNSAGGAGRMMDIQTQLDACKKEKSDLLLQLNTYMNMVKSNSQN